jgi:hypothetical protein
MMIKIIFVLAFLSVNNACSNSDDSKPEETVIDDSDNDPQASTEYADIDFSHWKITLPVDLNNDNKPDEFQPSSLINFGYQTQENLIPFMYDDTTDTSIVFYTYPAGATTANSSYPRTELREQQTPGNNYNNWSLNEGGIMEGTLKIDSISEDNYSNRTYNRTIVMQIHGIISQEDMNAYDFDSNHAPPLLKMIWDEGHIKAYKKALVNESTSGLDLYDDSSSTWTDIIHDFGYVGFERFSIKIIAESGKLTITANNETHVFEDVSLQKWPFENYFKAGNYLLSTNNEAFAYVKYYQLEVSH